jgi:TrmH family RNA methyltransferase
MISKQKIKLVSSLKNKKFRDELGLFVAEGGKNVTDLAQKFRCQVLFATANWLSLNKIKAEEVFLIKNSDELKSVSYLTMPQEVVAVFQKLENQNINIGEIKNELTLALDCVQNTGNLGTIIRIADWFGISKVFCSLDTADIFNMKVVQATMGALANVEVYYVDLHNFINSAKQNEIQIFGTFLNGKNIYQQNLPKNGIIVLGNEGNGISIKIENLIAEKLFIPNFSTQNQTSESLNVAVATAIVCSEFRRKSVSYDTFASTVR